MDTFTLFDFSEQSKLDNWYVVDDAVMGGRSSSTIGIDDEAHGIFEGRVSLENNGGFSSVRHRFSKVEVKNYTKVAITIRGDGKDYQFRLKADSRDYYSYTAPFSTTGEWQEIEILLDDMYPTFRGRRPNLPNFDRQYIEELTFLIGNKKNETFKLRIDKIELR